MKKNQLKKIVKEVLDASTPAPNNIPGGLAQFATIGDLATMHKLPLDQIIKQIIKGVKVESEHTTDLDIAMEIAFDHVYEDPKYYDKLSNIEEGKHDPVQPGILKKRLDEEIKKINLNKLFRDYYKYTNLPKKGYVK
jgi:hypothetical protein